MTNVYRMLDHNRAGGTSARYLAQMWIALLACTTPRVDTVAPPALVCPAWSALVIPGAAVRACRSDGFIADSGSPSEDAAAAFVDVLSAQGYAPFVRSADDHLYDERWLYSERWARGTEALVVAALPREDAGSVLTAARVAE